MNSIKSKLLSKYGSEIHKVELIDKCINHLIKSDKTQVSLDDIHEIEQNIKKQIDGLKYSNKQL